MSKVDIICCAYNAEKTISLTIESVLNQTYKNFSFYIIDDGSTDNTLEVCNSYKNLDDRIIVVSINNVGLTKALIYGVDLGDGKLIARIDADDTWSTSKLDIQVDYFKKYNNLVLCGTFCTDVFVKEKKSVAIDMPIFKKNILDSIYRFNPFVHSSVVFLRSVYEACGGYDEVFTYSQDYDLWARMIYQGDCINLSDNLVTRIVSPSCISYARQFEQRKFAVKVRLKIFFRNFSIFNYLAIYQLLKDCIRLFQYYFR